MSQVVVRHNPALTVEQALEVFQKGFEGKYRVYPTPRLVVGDFIVHKNAVASIFVTLKQSPGQTAFKLVFNYPTAAMRLLLMVLFPISFGLIFTVGRALEKEVQEYIRTEPAFIQPPG
jgi:hypothetical protein